MSCVKSSVSFPTFFQLSLLCLSDPQMPSYFFSKARSLFLSFANLFFLMQPHPTRFSPFLLFPPSCPPSFFTCCFFPSLHFLCDSQRIKPERSAVSFFLFWRSPYKTEFRNSARHGSTSLEDHALSSFILIFSMREDVPVKDKCSSLTQGPKN